MFNTDSDHFITGISKRLLILLSATAVRLPVALAMGSFHCLRFALVACVSVSLSFPHHICPNDAQTLSHTPRRTTSNICDFQHQQHLQMSYLKSQHFATIDDLNFRDGGTRKIWLTNTFAYMRMCGLNLLFEQKHWLINGQMPITTAWLHFRANDRTSMTHTHTLGGYNVCYLIKS